MTDEQGPPPPEPSEPSASSSDAAGASAESAHPTKGSSDSIFSGGLETYRTVTEEDYRSLLANGLVVVDTTTLLDLYRYHAKTREDLLSVFGRLKGRIWVPRHVMREFLDGRLSVIDSRSEEVSRTLEKLQKPRPDMGNAIRHWGKRFGLRERATELVGIIDESIDKVIKELTELSADDTFKDAEDITKDPVFNSLSPILEGDVGDPLPLEEIRAARAEAFRRIDAHEPPGWKDADKRDNPEGDYLIWYETLQEARRRGVDVLFVTGDVKEDWWRKERGESKGPLPELVHEMRSVADVQLFMLRPESLLLHASALGLTVSEESIEDAQRVTSERTVDRNIGSAQFAVRRAATSLTKAMLVLGARDGNSRTYDSLAEPVNGLVVAQGQPVLTTLLKAVWTVIDAANTLGVFGGTGPWSPSPPEQEVWAALDNLYVNAVQVWLEYAVDHAQINIMRNRVIADYGPLPPHIVSVDSSRRQSPGHHERVMFTALMDDGREASTARVYPPTPRVRRS